MQSKDPRLLSRSWGSAYLDLNRSKIIADTMIEDIEITNFRCFDRLKVSGFKRVNLISGKNNVGKTALLEALHITNVPTKDTIFSLGKLRLGLSHFKKEFSEQIWHDLIFGRNANSCLFKTASDDKKNNEIIIWIDREKDVFKNIKSLTEKRPQEENMSKEIIKNIKSLWGESSFSDGNKLMVSIHIYTEEGCCIRLVSPFRNHEDIVRYDSNRDYIQNSLFVPSATRSSNINLTQQLDKARLDERDDEVVRAFQIIDPSIVAVESFSIPEPTIYLKRQGEKRIPLSLFGDAMNRMADIILKIINNQDSVLLIDEIENGIHHSNQVAFWEFLYKLADRLNVQIFATTHSLEMTRAFLQAGLNQPEISAAHFELTRHEKTNKIVAIERDLETLEYAIDRNKEVRGGT